MTFNTLSVPLPRRGEFHQPQTISSDWLAAGGATRSGTFRLINGLALLNTTPTLTVCTFPAPVGHTSDGVFQNHSLDAADRAHPETTKVDQDLPDYCALSYAENQASIPASEDNTEPKQSAGLLTLVGPTRSISINMEVIEDAAWAAYKRGRVAWLWLDTLCVMLDDEDDLHWHQEHRPQLYSNAESCIVLLAGLGRHGLIQETTGYFSTYRTLLDIVCPEPADVMVLHSWPEKYGSGQWYLPQPTVMASNSVCDSNM